MLIFWPFVHIARPMHQIAMDLALLTGLRRGDLIALTRDNVLDEGLRVETSKTEMTLLFKWTPKLLEVIESARNIPPRVWRHIICNRAGHGYTPDGFSTVWKRVRERAIKDGSLTEAYRFNDIRAKSASDDADVERASQRLEHTSHQTTERYYLRMPRKVSPLR